MLREVDRAVLHLGAGGVFAEEVSVPVVPRGPDGPRDEAAAAIRANIGQQLHACGAERAFKAADARVGRSRRQASVAMLAGRSELEGHQAVALFWVPSPGVTKSMVVGTLVCAVCQVPRGTMRNSPGFASSPTWPRPSNSNDARPASRHTISSPAGCISYVSQSESKLKQEKSTRPLNWSKRWFSSCQMVGVTATGVAEWSGLTTTKVELRFIRGLRPRTICARRRRARAPSLHVTRCSRRRAAVAPVNG